MRVSHSLQSAITRTEPKLPGAWAQASAEIVDRFDEIDLPETIVRALSTLVPFDHCVQFLYRPNGGPLPLYDQPFGDRNPVGLANYIGNTYMLDPFFKRYCRGVASGAYRMRDLGNNHVIGVDQLPGYPVSIVSTEEIGYLTDGWPANREEVSIALQVPKGECAEIVLARPWSEKGFSGEEVLILSSVVPFLEAAFKRFWQAHRYNVLIGAGSKLGKSRNGSADLGLLSPREQQVANLLLGGYSTLAISLHLGISGTTVKSHRKNLYAKLGIATQFELFALLMQRP